jgi:hypothetical protein
MKRIIFIVVCLAILAGYLYFSGPDNVVIGERGNVEGLVNKTRALIQGRKFWKAQFVMANEEFEKINAPQKPSSAEMQELYREMRAAERALDDKMKVLYTPEESDALQLRIKADSLDRASKWKGIDDEAEKKRMKELDRLKLIIPLIQARLGTVTQ